MARKKALMHLLEGYYDGPECESHRANDHPVNKRAKTTQTEANVTCPECLHWMLKRAVARLGEIKAEVRTLQTVTKQCLEHGIKWDKQ